MIFGEHALGHRRQHDGNVVLLGERADFVLHARLHGAEADREQRLLRCGK